MLDQLSEILVDVGDHAVEGGFRIIVLICVWRCIAIVHQVRFVGRIGRNVAQEGLVPIVLYEAHGLVEPDVGAIARVVDRPAVVEVDVVEVVVSQMLLTEHPGAVTAAGKEIGHCHLVSSQNGPAPAGGPGAVAQGIVAGHQRAARGRAQGRDVVVSTAYRLVVKAVDVGCLEPGITGTAQIGIPLIVGQYKYDVGPT